MKRQVIADKGRCLGQLGHPHFIQEFYPVLNAYIAGSELQYSHKIIWIKYLLGWSKEFGQRLLSKIG